MRMKCNGIPVSHLPNKNVQEAAWLRIAESIGLTKRPDFVRTKWRDLRDTYRKKLKFEAPKSGDAGGSKKNKWPWMKAMEFTKGFFNLEVPTTSNFQRDRSSPAKTA